MQTCMHSEPSLEELLANRTPFPWPPSLTSHLIVSQQERLKEETESPIHGPLPIKII